MFRSASSLLSKLNKIRFSSGINLEYKEFKDIKLEINKEKDITKVNFEEDKLGFGETFSPHMLIIDHSENTGWENAKITPLENFSIHPANSTLHYALTCYDGIFFYNIM